MGQEDGATNKYELIMATLKIPRNETEIQRWRLYEAGTLGKQRLPLDCPHPPTP